MRECRNIRIYEYLYIQVSPLTRFVVLKTGLHNTGLQVLKIMCLSLVGPLTALTFCVGLVMCSSERVSSQIQQAVVARLSGSVTSQPSNEVARIGLDESTIESYKKVELGESRRLPTGSSDVVCPICLSEYATKETVRCLPECEHCFHTECIDAWLKLHSSARFVGARLIVFNSLVTFV